MCSSSSESNLCIRVWYSIHAGLNFLLSTKVPEVPVCTVPPSWSPGLTVSATKGAPQLVPSIARTMSIVNPQTCCRHDELFHIVDLPESLIVGSSPHMKTIATVRSNGDSWPPRAGCGRHTVNDEVNRWASLEQSLHHRGMPLQPPARRGLIYELLRGRPHRSRGRRDAQLSGASAGGGCGVFSIANFSSGENTSFLRPLTAKWIKPAANQTAQP